MILLKPFAAATGAAALVASTLAIGTLGLGTAPATASDNQVDTATPIKHVVVIFGENVSFDHYFATYPKAANTPAEVQQGTGSAAPTFDPAKNTPTNIATLAHDMNWSRTTPTRYSRPVLPLPRP